MKAIKTIHRFLIFFLGWWELNCRPPLHFNATSTLNQQPLIINISNLSAESQSCIRRAGFKVTEEALLSGKPASQEKPVFMCDYPTLTPQRSDTGRHSNQKEGKGGKKERKQSPWIPSLRKEGRVFLQQGGGGGGWEHHHHLICYMFTIWTHKNRNPRR